MAVGTIIGAAVGGLASAGASYGISKLFGGKTGSTSVANAGAQIAKKIKVPQINTGGIADQFASVADQFKATPFGNSSTTPGFTSTVGPDGNVSLTRSSEVNNSLAGLRTAGLEAEGGLTGLLDELRPGFGRLTQARTQAIDTARQRSISDLRESLGRRRIAGSSFANDSITRSEREFADADAAARAQSFIEEVDATQQLIGQRFQARQEVVKTELAQTNYESSIAAGLQSQALSALESSKQILAQIGLAGAQAFATGTLKQADLEMDKYRIAYGGGNATAQAKINSDQATAQGSTYGQLFQPTIKAIQGGASDWATGLFNNSPFAPTFG